MGAGEVLAVSGGRGVGALFFFMFQTFVGRWSRGGVDWSGSLLPCRAALLEGRPRPGALLAAAGAAAPGWPLAVSA